MPVTRFFVPSVVVKNVSKKAVRVVGRVVIDPGQTVDLYRALDVPVELFEDQIIKNLEKPHGDLYFESQITGNIVIITLKLTSFYYSVVSPVNINAVNDYSPGLIPSAVNDDEFEWISAAGFTVEPPLVLDGTNLYMPPASGSSDGYLSKEDWARFNASARGALRIWQYQDFSASVSSSVTLSAFENGSGLSFNSSYIIDGTAAVVLVSDNSRPPTTTLTFPASVLPGNRVTVTSHIGTTVVFNSAPESTLNVRVFFLVSLPANVALPNDYQESPQFTNDATLDYLDDVYVNQNADETVYGSKTFDDVTVFDSTIQYTVNPVDGYYLQSDASGNASWAPVTGGGGGGTITGASNVGTEGFGVFAQVNGATLEFKNVAANSSNVLVTQDLNDNIKVDVDLTQLGLSLNLDGYFSLTDDETVGGHTTFDPTTSTDPAFTITPDISAPTTNVSDGSVTYVGGIQYNYDGTRAKWLSNDRKFLTAGRSSNNVSNAYLEVDQSIASSDAGYRLLRDGTITGMWAQTRDVETWTFEIRRNSVTTPISSLSIVAARGDSSSITNIDVLQDDEIQFYVNGTAVSKPVVGIEVAWRI